jgi:glycosyltransferase involved in cell wall biosynthesis
MPNLLESRLDVGESSRVMSPHTPELADSVRSSRGKCVSVVMPVFNEVAVLRTLTSLVMQSLESTGHEHEIVYVDDGSSDGSAELLDELAASDSRVRVVHFSRNFGQQPALQAGLAAARGDAVIVMDSDLQDDPQAIPRFLKKWEAGFEVVYAIRLKRKENAIKRFFFRGFYRVLQQISSTPIPVDAGNFGLIDRRVVNELLSLPEVSRFYPGLRHWVGFRQCGEPVERAARHDDQPRVSFWGLVRLAKTAIFSFSSVPLGAFYYLAGLSCLVFFGLVGFSLYHKLFTGEAIPGWTSGLLTASFFGTLNALGIAILGEYVIRIFDQVRLRPTFIVDRTVNVATTREREAVREMVV